MSRLLRRLLSPAPSATVQRDTVRLRLEDVEIEILRVRDPRARRIKLSVDERGARLTLPPRASLVMGERFLELHREWLGLQLRHYQGHGLPAALQPGVEGVLPLRGELLPLFCENGLPAPEPSGIYALRLERETDSRSRLLLEFLKNRFGPVAPWDLALQSGLNRG